MSLANAEDGTANETHRKELLHSADNPPVVSDEGIHIYIVY